MSDAASDVERALGELARDPGEKGPVEPRHARRLLLALGAAAIDAGPELPETLVARCAALLDARGAAWDAALGRELELAVWEYDTSVDPRYLDRADYDHVYTREARERIDARLAALDLLDRELPEPLATRLAAADARYAPFADR